MTQLRKARDVKMTVLVKEKCQNDAATQNRTDVKMTQLHKGQMSNDAATQRKDVKLTSLCTQTDKK